MMNDSIITLPSYGCCSSFKYYKFTTTRDHLNYSECPQTRLCARPHWEAHSATQDPLASSEGNGCPCPRTPPPFSAPWVSVFGPSGLSVPHTHTHTLHYFLTPLQFYISSHKVVFLCPNVAKRMSLLCTYVYMSACLKR